MDLNDRYQYPMPTPIQIPIQINTFPHRHVFFKGCVGKREALQTKPHAEISFPLRKTVGGVWRHGPEPFPCCVFLFFGAPLSELMHMQKLEKLFLQAPPRDGLQAVVGATSPGRPAKPK